MSLLPKLLPTPAWESKICGAFITYETDATALVLGTGFNQFSALCGVGGLAKEHEDTGHIEVLAVHSNNPGRGQFRAFVAQLKRSFNKVTFWHEFNPRLGLALARYGFWQIEELCQLDGVILPGWRWEK